MEPPVLKQGMTLERVDLGIPFEGQLSTFGHDGQRLWTSDDFALLASAIGRQGCARALSESGRMLEGAFLDVDTCSLLLVPPLYADLEPGLDSGQERAGIVSGALAEEMEFTLTGHVVQLIPAESPRFGDGLIRELAGWLTETSRLAAERGESVSVVLGTEPPSPAPDRLVAFCAHRDGDEWRCHVLAQPVPERSNLWVAPIVDPDGECAYLNAPATPATVGVVGLLIVAAVAAWRVDPHLLTVEYGVAPDGPAPQSVLRD